MVKTIKVIGCTGFGLLLIFLLPLCLFRNERLPQSNGTFDGDHLLCTNINPGPSGELEVEGEGWRHRLMRLHRQKRYLLFPEGSSFQLVFDIIIPIVDYTNYAILGITCSVAWELPSKAPSELIENVLTRINDGTIGTVRRNGSVPEPDPKAPSQNWNQKLNQDQDNRDAANWQATHALPANPPAYAANDHGYQSYYTNIPRIPASYPYANSANANSDANANGQQRQAPMPANWHARQSWPKWQRQGAGTGTGVSPWSGASKDNWWTRNGQRVQQNWREKQRMWNPSKWTSFPSSGYSQRPRQVLKSPPKHRIYPVFAKRRRRRSLEQDPHFEQFHLQQHLSSRQLLFGKIERLYKSQRLNGTSCVQRALCESAQRQKRLQGRGAPEPQSFIMELLSAIFQLPSSQDIDDPKELELLMSPHYLEAHRQQNNCRQLYGDCTHSFWSD
ncbi:uncharacterized protein LOC6503408 [Drosophila ananassae]|uniref:uncharacterized protein LOC6503408 n=1 Tax=Drosophila ananassae TaxID=7217 RepID=UPI0013A5CC81|nr:uncharacterized protein LOC6503408 [Drosophila ananassae]XP_044569985.1 uncharacterized protein LOC6503408 [Drosophila ananassae]